ncbi:MAG: SDR family oxidoreductase [Bacteroidia bacterium]|nr:MAG: SDR family oxidoreductase [Bacteroidia bacterium]
MQDKVIIVTGASSGIGKALVEESLRLGAKVVLAARRIEPMQEIISGVSPDQYLLIKTDVSLEADCRLLIDKSIERFGRIDVLINNAGVSMRALFSETDLLVIQRLMQVNFWGAVYCSKYALPHLIASGGSLVGVSSIAGFKGLPARSGYSASKFALQGFLESVRIENLNTGLHVLIACPGFTASNIRKTALAKDGSIQGESPRNEEKMMTSEMVAKRILRSVIGRKRTLVLTTQGKLTLLINKFFPGLTDKLVYKHLAKEPDSPLKER